MPNSNALIKRRFLKVLHYIVLKLVPLRCCNSNTSQTLIKQEYLWN